MDYTHIYLSTQGVVEVQWQLVYVVHSFKVFCPSKYLFKYLNFMKISKWHPASNKDVRNVHFFPHDYLGPEGCCVPSLDDVYKTDLLLLLFFLEHVTGTKID